MSEALGRIQAAAKRTGGYSRSVLADDLREVVARVAKLEAALTKLSTAARKDTSLVPEDPLLVFIVGVVDAALSETVEA